MHRRSTVSYATKKASDARNFQNIAETVGCGAIVKVIFQGVYPKRRKGECEMDANRIRENPRFRRYPEYKESDVEWIDEIPNHF